MPSRDSPPPDEEADPRKGGGRAILITALAGAAVLAVLYALWPYQTGHLDHRSSVLRGLLMIIRIDQEWVFCPFVPIVVGFLVYQKRHVLARTPCRGSAYALIPLVLAVALYWLGYKANTRYLGFASAQLMIAALILWFWGVAWFRILFFHWLFLAFTWPMLPLEEILAFPLRKITAHLSSAFLNIVGVDNLREGTAIVSAPDFKKGIEQGAGFRLDVEDPCSGIRSLFSLIMISAFYGYIALRRPTHRLILFASSIPMAMAGNFVRILMLTFGSILFGSEFAVGSNDSPSTYHMFSGFMVFGVALAGMFGLARLLEKWGRPPPTPKETPATALNMTPATAFFKALTVIALGTATVLLCMATPVNRGLSDPGLKMTLPTALDGYRGFDKGMSSSEKQVFDEGVELSRSVYRAADGAEMMATLVLSGPVKRSLHRPTVCLPGQGWKILDQRVVTIPLQEGGTIEAMLLELVRDHQVSETKRVRARAYDLYFYAGYDVTTPNYHNHVVLSHVDNVFRNINHRWGMASFFISSLTPHDADPLSVAAQKEASIQKLTEFAGTLIPHILTDKHG